MAADVGKHVTDILKSDEVFFPPYTRYTNSPNMKIYIFNDNI